MSCVQVLGPKTYDGKQMAALGNHHRGKEVLADFYERQRHRRTEEGPADGQWNLVLYTMLHNMLNNYVYSICIYNMIYNTRYSRLYFKTI